MRIALCGGVYSNPWALRAFIDDARHRGAERLYCLGDLGGYGAEPDAVWPLLEGITCVAGNYDVSVAAGAEDCGCGYRDPRDNHYSQIMYDYTLRRTGEAFARWMGELPTERREEHGGCTLHMVHGSTIGLNDFWWESLPESEHRRRLAVSGADVIACTHSGIPWIKRFGRHLIVNVGVIGRPANDGDTRVWYALVDMVDGIATAQLVPLTYDWRSHADAISRVGLPEAFAVTGRTGWWTTCLEILPVAERARGRYHVYDSSIPALLEAVGLPAGAWRQADSDIPVCSLWGSPVMPSRVWHACSEVLPQLESAARRLGLQIGELRAARTQRGRHWTVPELTMTAEGWFYHPSRLDEPPLLPPARRPEDTVRQLSAARAAATQRLLEELQRANVLPTPVYCAA